MRKPNCIIYYTVVILCLVSNIVYSQEDSSFLQPPEILILSSDSLSDPMVDRHHIKDRKFTGIPSLGVSHNGRLWATWYVGITPDEDKNNYVVVAASSDNGVTWKEQIIIDPDEDGPVRAFDPELWIDPMGKLWIFWAQAIGHDGTIAGVWSLIIHNPDAEDLVLSPPRRLTNGVMMCKPIVLSTGEWILPASTWRFTENSAKLIVSNDHGLSWTEKGAVDVPKVNRNYDEHMIIERKDGSLWMLVRTNYGIGESISVDGGRSWSKLSPSTIEHPSARFFIRRLQSGNLLLVKHGPIDVKIRRSHLMAFISKDDGISWSKGLLIDQRKGVSYPDGQETKDGTIYLIYDYNRVTNQNVIVTSFTEQDILSVDYDKRMLEVFNNRMTVTSSINN